VIARQNQQGKFEITNSTALNVSQKHTPEAHLDTMTNENDRRREVTMPTNEATEKTGC
jgi:hypothetical protein